MSGFPHDLENGSIPGKPGIIMDFCKIFKKILEK